MRYFSVPGQNALQELLYVLKGVLLMTLLQMKLAKLITVVCFVCAWPCGCSDRCMIRILYHRRDGGRRQWWSDVHVRASVHAAVLSSLRSPHEDE